MLNATFRELLSRYRSSPLLKSGSWYLMATLIGRGLNYLAVFLFTRLLTLEEYGLVSIYMPWLLIFGYTITLNVYAAVTRAKYDFSPEEFPAFFSASTFLGTLTSLIALVVVWLLPEAWLGPIFGLPKVLILLAVLSTAAEISVYSSTAVWQAEYKYQLSSLASTGANLARILISLCFVLLPLPFLQQDHALGRILGMTSVSVVFGGFLLVRILTLGKVLIHTGYWRYTLVYSLPLIPHALSGLILSQIDRLMIDRYIGREEAGLYTLAYQIGELITMLWTATNTAWVPWFFEQMSKQDHETIRQRANQYLIGFAGITACFTVISPIILMVLSPARYWVARPVVPVVMGGMFFNLTYALYVNVEFYEKKTAYISAATTLAAILNILLNVLLLPRLGYSIAAWTTFVAYVALFLFHAWVVIRWLKQGYLFSFRLMLYLGVGITILSMLMGLVTSAW